MQEKRTIWILRLFWLFVLIISLLLSMSFWNGNIEIGFDILAYIVVFFPFVSLFLFIGALALSCKSYAYNGMEIIVYAGFIQHYIKIDGIKMDEHNTMATYAPIFLNCTLNDGTYIEATISLANRIALKINNQLYKR